MCCGDHFKGFACTDLVCKERVAAVKDMGNRIDLVRSERDFWADTAESDMTAVILTGSDRVKSIVVGTDKTVSAFWVFPYPILKRLLDYFLLCLCCRGFLMVKYRFSVAVFVQNIVKDTHITQIQRVLDNTIGGSPLCTVGAVRLDISVIGTLILYKPVAVYRRIAYPDSACRIARWGEPLLISVTASEDTEVLFLNIGKVLTTCTNACPFHAKLIQNLLTVCAAKNLQLSQRILHTTPKGIRARLMSYFSECVKRAGQYSFDIPYNRQQLADYLGVDRSAMCSELSRMQREGLLTYHKNHFSVHEALE